jgi:hypothetical protein
MLNGTEQMSPTFTSSTSGPTSTTTAMFSPGDTGSKTPDRDKTCLYRHKQLTQNLTLSY